MGECERVVFSISYICIIMYIYVMNLDRCVTVPDATTYIGKFSRRADLFIHGGVVQLSVRGGASSVAFAAEDAL